MTYVVVFNGPPHSGKDTLANCLHQRLRKAGISSRRKALSLPMRLVVYELLGISDRYNEEHYAANKDEVQWTGKTIRQMMIKLSEEWVKPAYGKQFWTDRAFQAKDSAQVLIFSDGGFREEIDRMLDLVGEENLLLVQIERLGTDWSKDSRGYLTAPNMFRLWNRRTPEYAVAIVEDWIEGAWNLTE